MTTSRVADRVFSDASPPSFQRHQLRSLSFVVKEIDGLLIQKGKQLQERIAGRQVRILVLNTVVSERLLDPLSAVAVAINGPDPVRRQYPTGFGDDICWTLTSPSSDTVLDNPLTFFVAHR